MNDFLPVFREILRQYLSVTPMKGARLKPLVVREFERRTKENFHRAFYNYPRFTDLLKANSDLVEIDRSGATDIIVRLCANQSAETAAVSPTTYISEQPYIQASLWHAFTNPDEKRRRFYNPGSAEVVHYVEGNGSSEPIQAMARRGADSVEIKPIPREDHSAWMKEFVESQSLPEGTRAALLSIAELPYTSQLNRAFQAALEKHAEGWRRYRTTKVLERIKAWAEKNSVSVPELFRPTPERAINDAISTVGSSPVTQVAGAPVDLRKLLHAAVDALDEAELVHVLLPATALVKIASGSMH